MHWLRKVGVGLLVAGGFLGGLAVGAHQPLVGVHAQTSVVGATQAQGQPGSPIQEYPLPNGVLCYTLSTASNSFSCVYAPGLAPATPRS